jgi:hypothetical protein
VPGQESCWQVFSALGEETIGIQRHYDTPSFSFDIEHFVPSIMRGGKEIRGGKLHFIADDNDLRGAVQRRHGFLHRDLTGFVEDVSFYRSLDEEHLYTSVAQVFNERGEGFIVRGPATVPGISA